MDSNSQTWIGKSVERLEDPELLQGNGKYVDDLSFDNLLYMKVVRSNVARAKIMSIETNSAATIPGIVGIYTAKDFNGIFRPLPPMAGPGVTLADLEMPVLESQFVNFVGDPVAIVVGKTQAICEDAVSQVEIDYETLTPITDPKKSLENTDTLHSGLKDNVLMYWSKKTDNFEEIIDQANTIVEGEFNLPRIVAAPMEPRGCIISYNSDTNLVEIWASSQDPHRPSSHISQIFDLPLENVRTIIPEVGGAFGSKGGAPQEYILACAASMKLHCPIKWIEDRSENFLSSYQGRGMSAKVKLALDAQGHFLALEADILADLGAYLFPSTPIAPFTAATLLNGGYKIPAAKVSLSGVATNKVPTGPYRGAGRPEACYFIEQIVDIAARTLQIDPLELRLKNLIQPDEFPYQTPLGPIYDSGDYETVLIRANELIHESISDSSESNGWVAYEPPKQSPPQQNSDKFRPSITGSAVILSVEPAGAGFWESGYLEISGDHKVIAHTGSSAHGQGHKTSFTQILADKLGVPFESISLLQGDSSFGPGVGTFGSRSILLGGEALALAARDIKQTAANWASRYFEASVDDLVWDRDTIHVQGSPEPNLSLFDIAEKMRSDDIPDKLTGSTRANISGPSFPFGSYAATVRIDLETGIVKLEKLIAVDDAGTIVNPMLAEGQIVGSSLQGVSSALWEEMIYDSDGLPVNGSFMDYLIPTAKESDFLAVNEFRNTPTPYTTLGAKGVGESGTVGALAAVASALNNALYKIGFTGHVDPTFSPMKIWEILRSLS